MFTVLLPLFLLLVSKTPAKCSPAKNYFWDIKYLPTTNYCWCHGIDENPGQGLIIGVNDTGNNLSLVTAMLAFLR